MTLYKIKKEECPRVWKGSPWHKSLGRLDENDFIITIPHLEDDWDGYIRVLSKFGVGYVSDCTIEII